MQSMEVISINIWQILISLCNLLVLFLILKKFLYKPVKKAMAERQAAVEEQYGAAEEAERNALASKEEWAQKLQNAGEEADSILKSAVANAPTRRGDKIVAEAKEKADGIIRQAEAEAELERKKAEAGIRREIVDVSAQLTEKMLNREIRPEDHRELIDSFIQEIGEDDDADE